MLVVGFIPLAFLRTAPIRTAVLLGGKPGLQGRVSDFSLKSPAYDNQLDTKCCVLSV